ncbi:hypothetical protein UlMin_040551 [Ulmus minor]
MEKKKKKVMVAIDESESSYYALIWVLDNLKEITSTEWPLVIFATQLLPNCHFSVGGSIAFAGLFCPLSPRDLIKQNIERNRKVSLALLEKARSICACRGVKVETYTEIGDPKEAICNAVEDHKINLLVIGDNNDGAIKRALLGSLTDYCLRKSKCPVLVVKKPKEDMC